MTLQLNNITSGYKNREIIKNISFKIGLGEALCILGPNGVGKTTLLKTILGFIKPKIGEILLNGKRYF